MSIELNQAIATLRSELLEAMSNQSEESGLRLRVDSVELQLEVSVESSTSAKGGVKFYVFEAGVSGEDRESTKNVVRVTFTPEGVQGTSVYTSDVLPDMPL